MRQFKKNPSLLPKNLLSMKSKRLAGKIYTSLLKIILKFFN